MTGFGAGTVERDGFTARVEIRSVNHRHLTVKVRLPGELAWLEQDVEGRVRKALERGSVSVSVQVVRRASPADVAVDEDLAARYHDLLTGLAGRIGVAPEVSLADLAALPGVFANRELPERDPAEQETVARAVDAALDELVAMRTGEGERMVDDLRVQAAAVAEIVAGIQAKMPEVVTGHRAGLVERVGELIGQIPGGRPVAEADVAREIALLADKLDVSEELTRLQSHLVELDEILNKGGAIGRRLDFLAQEFFREANTVGSKCNDAAVAHAVVDLKTCIERLREQVQNVE